MDCKERLIQELIDEGYLKTPRIIEAFRAIDRADFIRPEHSGEAYGNYPLPIGEGQTISQPLTVAFMLELLDPQPGEKILDIGSGSGWTTALLTHIVGENGKVFGIERIPELCEFGKRNLAKYFGEDRATIICADGAQGFPEEAPFGPAPFADWRFAPRAKLSAKGAGFDKILAGASAVKEIPEAWREQLKVGGKIVAPVGGSIWLYEKLGENKWREKEFPGFVFVPFIKGESGGSPTSLGKSLVKSDFTSDKKYWRIFFTSCFLLLASVAVFANEIYFSHSSYSGSKSVEISSGLGSRKIAELLKNEGVIRSKWVFIFYVSLTGNAAGLKPGSYVFGRESFPQIVEGLVREGTNDLSITIPEGWNVKDIAEYLEKEDVVRKDQFIEVTDYRGLASTVDRFDFLKDKPIQLGLEGYLFPDTYRIFRDVKPEDIVVKMLDNFGKKLTVKLREKIVRQGKTIFEVVTMASLIEKEVVSEEERRIVSGILWKRLEAGIPLQVDATLTYITGKKTTKISREETQINSPYNTYKYRGLPLGPISNPGLSAIRAAIYPQDSPYLYYLSKLDGRTIFSKTLEEHNEAKAKYLTR